MGPTGGVLLVSDVLGNDVPELSCEIFVKGRSGASSSWLEHH